MVINSNFIKLEIIESGIGVITLNRPEKKNAFNVPMMQDLTQILLDCDINSEIRVVILKGAGNNFCSGGEVSRENTASIDEHRFSLVTYVKVIETIQNMEKTVIAMVEGFAVGGGMSIALACDIIYASTDAKFLSNFCHLGLAPEMGQFLFLPRTVGLYNAKKIWLEGKRLSAEEGKAYGFVSEVCTPEEIEEKTITFAKLVSSLPSSGVRIMKKISNGVAYSELHSVLNSETQNTPFCISTEEIKEFTEALMAKMAKKK